MFFQVRCCFRRKGISIKRPPSKTIHQTSIVPPILSVESGQLSYPLGTRRQCWEQVVTWRTVSKNILVFLVPFRADFQPRGQPNITVFGFNPASPATWMKYPIPSETEVATITSANPLTRSVCIAFLTAFLAGVTSWCLFLRSPSKIDPTRVSPLPALSWWAKVSILRSLVASKVASLSETKTRICGLQFFVWGGPSSSLRREYLAAERASPLNPSPHSFSAPRYSIYL